MTHAASALLLEGIHQAGETLLVRAGHAVQRVDRALPAAELMPRLPGIQALGIRSKTNLTAEVLSAAPDLEVVGAYCIGTNQIDLDAALRRGICVFHAPYSNTRSVAEMVIAEIIVLARRLGDRFREMHLGQWRKTAGDAHEVRGRTLGIVGYGHIGSQVGLLAEALGMRVVYFDTNAKLPLGNSKAMATLNEVLAIADVVTLHVPESPSTRGMLGTTAIAAMKRGAHLINASRGSVVDLPAAAEALKSGHLAGLALDVFPDEPDASTSDGFRTPVAQFSNVLLTPHIGGSTLEAQEAIGHEVSASLVRYLDSGCTIGSVNFPAVEMEQAPLTSRIAHTHKNVPGVLRDVNRVVSDLGANIHRQTLATRGEVGYLLMDFDHAVADEVCRRLAGLETTIRVRTITHIS